ncbi:hypothetical protein KFL_000710360 [Klebsormidium nitens]|uniref:Uncharacterized protein n=1 Tax=Klebsormidium nitens TaxID=105231 RepID=A0A1Y1HVX3_KLENI|nr:hypothetical protein KFL_000710360 [Klebsormidium nitens]|eukprot:GAQ81131.1 hypothetical protein KFL_000710360 [Klebsormidium nitens]
MAESAAADDYRKHLLAALESIERPGSFSFGASLKSFFHPGLEVPELGSVGLPLTYEQAQQLAKLCSQAPFGRRERIIYDDSVRKCLQLSPDQFSLAGPGWDAQVQKLANQEVKRGLGLPEGVKIVANAYKLLLYEVGGHFKVHQDTEKEDGMFGTLVFVLPSAHSGGELVVRHAGKKNTYDYAREDVYAIHYAAFFADCEHELLPIQTGYRLALIYNLVVKSSNRFQGPADNTKATAEVAEAIKRWTQDSNGTKRVVFPLEHQYTQESLSYDRLRGRDIATVEVLLQAAKTRNAPDVHLYLGMLQKFESRKVAYPERDFDTSFAFSNAVPLHGYSGTYKCIRIKGEELISEIALAGREWEEEEERSTGNEGTMEERWFHHAALVIWPHARHWKIAYKNDQYTVLKEACSLSDTVTALPRLLEAACLTQGRLSLGEASTVATLVLEHGHVYAVEELAVAVKELCAPHWRLSNTSDPTVAGLIAKHGYVDLAKVFIRKYGGPRYSEDPGVVVLLGARFGWKALETAVIDWLHRTFALAYGDEDCFRLLLQICDAAPKEQMNIDIETQTGENGKGLSVGTGRTEGDSNILGNEQERWAVVDKALAALVTSTSTKWSGSSSGLTRLTELLSKHYFGQVLERFGWQPWMPAIDCLILDSLTCSLNAIQGLLGAVTVLHPDVEMLGASSERTQAAATSGNVASMAADICQKLSGKLVSQLLDENESNSSAERYPYTQYYISRLLGALHCWGFDGDALKKLVAHFVAHPQLYDLDKALLPALTELWAWLKELKEATSPAWIVEFCRGCLEALDRSRGDPPLRARDWAARVECGCGCLYCKHLVEFCLDPVKIETQSFAGLGIQAKAHVIDSIQREETVYDDSVRKCLQLSPDQFSLAGRGWDAQVQKLANQEVKRGLGLPDGIKVVANPYKLLLYQFGGHFKVDRDSEKENGTFGTLVFVLPSAHSGGEHVIRHAGQTNTYDFANDDVYAIHYAAFFGECEHGILPIQAGYRLALIYNLIAKVSHEDIPYATWVRAKEAIPRPWKRKGSGRVPKKRFFVLDLKQLSQGSDAEIDRAASEYDSEAEWEAQGVEREKERKARRVERNAAAFTARHPPVAGGPKRRASIALEEGPRPQKRSRLSLPAILPSPQTLKPQFLEYLPIVQGNELPRSPLSRNSAPDPYAEASLLAMMAFYASPSPSETSRDGGEERLVAGNVDSGSQRGVRGEEELVVRENSGEPPGVERVQEEENGETVTGAVPDAERGGGGSGDNENGGAVPDAETQARAGDAGQEEDREVLRIQARDAGGPEGDEDEDEEDIRVIPRRRPRGRAVILENERRPRGRAVILENGRRQNAEKPVIQVDRMGKIKDLVRLPIHFVRFNPAKRRYGLLKDLLERLFLDSKGAENAAGVYVHFVGYPEDRVRELNDEEEFCFQYASVASID